MISPQRIEPRISRRSAFSWLVPSALLTLPRCRAQQLTAATGRIADKPVQLPLRNLIDSLIVTSGPYAGACRTTPGGPVNWYFSNLGLAFMVSTLPDAVRNHMDAYIRHLDPSLNTISDVANDLVTPVPPDSHDAYAGTFLSLAVKYARASADSIWWNANLPRLKAVAWCNLAKQIKANGLVRAFQAPAANGIGYLMDQCEAYAGLRDFGQYLIETDDPDAGYYSTFGMNLGIAIHSLFDANANRWNWCDVPSPAGNVWYPDITAQIYPHLYDVHSADAPGDYYRLHRGFDVLTAAVPNWMTEPQDLYPWLVVGYYAASCRNLTADARRMLDMALQYYLPGLVNTGRMLISEFGYAEGIMNGGGAFMPSSLCPATANPPALL